MNKAQLIYAMELSALAYKEVQPEFPRETLIVIDDGSTGVQCYIRKSPGLLLITFRGSNSAQDWDNNLTFWKKAIPYDNPSSDIRVHAGFINAYKSPNVRGRLHNLMTPDVASVRIAGHSQGAALALLCGVDLEYNFPTRDYQVSTFGCPRVGNRAFQKSYNKRVPKTLRVENGNDVITKIPFACWGYRHVGAKLHIGPLRLPWVYSFEQHRQHAYIAHLFQKYAP